MILSISEAIELKKKLRDQFSVELHFHDGCGGQYFSLEKSSDELVASIKAYCAGRNICALFSADGLSFTVQEGKPC